MDEVTVTVGGGGKGVPAVPPPVLTPETNGL